MPPRHPRGYAAPSPWREGRRQRGVAGGRGGEGKEEGDDRSKPHISQLVAGALQAMQKYVGLQMGPRTLNIYKMAHPREDINCNDIIWNR